MTPQKKAQELGNKMYNGDVFKKTKQEHLDELEISKLRATVVADEIINFFTKVLDWDEKTNGNIHYWQEVIEEIESL